MDISAELKKDGRVFITWGGETHSYIGKPFGEYIICSNVFAGRFPHGKRVWPLDVLIWPNSGHIAISEGGYANKGGARILVGWYRQSHGSAA